MSVYIKGMEMPKSCRQCSLYLQSMDSERKVYENCAVTAKSYNWGLTTRPSDCPLVPVPQHGRLIDVDAVLLEGGPYEYEEWCKWALDRYMDAPTVIPAEEGE